VNITINIGEKLVVEHLELKILMQNSTNTCPPPTPHHAVISTIKVYVTKISDQFTILTANKMNKLNPISF
jgi:hypothetical protein